MNEYSMFNFNIWRNQVIKARDISPLKFGMSQEEVIEILGKPDDISMVKVGGKPLILKYHDIELHFDERWGNNLFLIYSDYEIELSIMQTNSK